MKIKTLHKQAKAPMFYFTPLRADGSKFTGFQIGFFGLFFEAMRCHNWRKLFTKFRGQNFILIYSSLGFSVSFSWFKLK